MYELRMNKKLCDTNEAIYGEVIVVKVVSVHKVTCCQVVIRY